MGVIISLGDSMLYDEIAFYESELLKANDELKVLEERLEKKDKNFKFFKQLSVWFALNLGIGLLSIAVLNFALIITVLLACPIGCYLIYNRDLNDTLSIYNQIKETKDKIASYKEKLQDLKLINVIDPIKSENRINENFNVKAIKAVSHFRR